MPYKILHTADVAAYITALGIFGTDQACLSIEEIGNGNINYIFRIKNNNTQKTIILKQARPYLRCMGESRLLTTDRARIEAEALKKHGELCPEHTVKIEHYDHELAAIFMEDLSSPEYILLRDGLMQAQIFAHFPAQIARYMANTLFYTSDFSCSQQEKKHQVSHFINPDLCQITEKLFFTEPYIDSVSNNVNPLLNATVADLRRNEVLQMNVAKLKEKFLTQAQALIHGDLHSGSIFVSHNNTKIIDAEFAFYGPIAFDIGSLIGNFMINFCVQSGLDTNTDPRKEYQKYLLNSMHTIWQTFHDAFKDLMQRKTTDITFQHSAYQAYYMDTLFKDMLGFAGTELIRRTIGAARSVDFNSITEPSVCARSEAYAVKLGEVLICRAEHLHDMRELISLVTEICQFSQPNRQLNR